MRVASLLLAVVALLGAGAAIGFYIVFGESRYSLQRQLQDSSAQLIRTRDDLSRITAQKEIADRDLSQRSSELAQTRATADGLTQRNTELLRERDLIQAKLQSKIETEQHLLREIAALKKELSDTKNSSLLSPPLPQDREKFYQNKIYELQAKVARLEDKLGYPAAAAEATESSKLENVPASLVGKVLDIGPHSSFVILNIGTKQGAVESLEMVLRRGDAPIAKILLTDVMDNYSIAQVLPDSMNGSVRPGDVAARSF